MDDQFGETDYRNAMAFKQAVADMQSSILAHDYIVLNDLYKAACDLNGIVEGAQSIRWTDGYGLRLKDTKEWCAFYVKLTQAKNSFRSGGEGIY